MTNARKPAATKSAAAKNGAAMFVLSEIISEIHEERPGIPVQGANGTVFNIPPAELWPDAATRLAGEDNEACSRLLLGDQYDEWVKQGGTFGVLNHIITKSAGADVGKSSAS